MPVVAVVNRKGGSGKSTLATHLAAANAQAGRRVMLGDVDRQQSSQTWLKLRAAQGLSGAATIAGWTIDPKNVLRAPAGITHVVLDTPGGMRGFELARIVMNADAILMPVCNSVFDRDSAAECYAELKTLPRIASGRCKVAAIGMRIDSRTRAAEVLARWAADLDLPFIGVLRDAQVYVRCVERGLTLFDLPAAQVQADLAQWQPILGWLEPVLDPAVAPTAAARPSSAAAPVSSAPAALEMIPDSLRNRPPSLATACADDPVASTLAAEPARRLGQPVPASPARPTTQPPPPADARPLPDSTQPSPAGAEAIGAIGTPRPAPATDGAVKSAPARAPVPDPARLDVTRRPTPLARKEPMLRGTVESRLGKLLEALPIPRFLQRNS